MGTCYRMHCITLQLHSWVKINLECSAWSGDSFPIRDNGPGIPIEYSRILCLTVFTVSTRVAAVRKGGTGLGLAIARQLAEAQGGELTSQQPFGRGGSVQS